MTNAMNDLERKILKLKKCIHVENSAPVYDLKNSANLLVNLQPDQKVSRGMFLPNHLLPGTFKAHPITIRALKKDILVGDLECLDLEDIHICDSCKNKIDRQFWHFCPFCESNLPEKS
ncbi:MAG: hypothetical protein A2381_11750 [Bdellovibrionales bacterium RIFOXYB1_FULL_37_110]|nr:MAG: hypothetical protein A2181_05585 [Bdellovibrionales bacterium RIFOXYA1_FULL_38_20]OFZ49229.1 MAG: hypothetical protein A2417_16990 [Bdellovibrionales bacterium RIFOXYC1_FULL_37_79]OFZ58477.1 MAG: hypothetical protein A2381_11750 [Bdellovibrionales bacterium RIFOXYB1_FULL_37_110]OFZ61490.1 MAG: hypothetical protein A2577_00270 [Bdellovibrionales bacterium RIFOXYD1_FULL_36_51]